LRFFPFLVLYLVKPPPNPDRRPMFFLRVLPTSHRLLWNTSPGQLPWRSVAFWSPHRSPAYVFFEFCGNFPPEPFLLGANLSLVCTFFFFLDYSQEPFTLFFSSYCFCGCRFFTSAGPASVFFRSDFLGEFGKHFFRRRSCIMDVALCLNSALHPEFTRRAPSSFLAPLPLRKISVVLRKCF